MSIGLDQLAKYSAQGVGMPSSDLLRQQCLDFADYARRTRWHFSVRSEAKQLAKMFDLIAKRCGKEGVKNV